MEEGYILAYSFRVLSPWSADSMAWGEAGQNDTALSVVEQKCPHHGGQESERETGRGQEQHSLKGTPQ
jgi:hypothetical protein